mgnify:CR=1 FL=1
MTEILIPQAFKGLFEPHRYKAFYGGRGSAKSHSIAAALVLMSVQKPLRIVCAREIQKSIRDSVKQLIEDKITAYGLQDHFTVLDTEIRSSLGGKFTFMGLWRNPDAVKSLEGADIFWGEEAARFSQRSLDLVRPTMRKPGSELWFSWNPEFEDDPVNKLFRGEAGPPPGSLVREVSWKDNPWFAQSPMMADLEHDYATNPVKAKHVWGGGYVTAVEGAYYAEALTQAETEGRVGFVARDPMLPVRTYWDLGVSDSCSIWVCQFVGQKILLLDYIEGQGQPLAYYAEALRQRGWEDAEVYLPHDGRKRDNLTATPFEDHVREAGFKRVKTLPNAGKGAALRRIEDGRRIFGRCWFSDTATRDGRLALAAYHERRDEKRGVGLGPEHDWASHGADAFGLMASHYEEPRQAKEEKRKPKPSHRAAPTGWMGA